jgi:hypothetical protein
VLSEVHRNLEICITEKERKVAPYRSKYSEWWLVLPDHISLGFNQRDIRDFAAMPPLEHSWQKVVLVNPLDPMDAVEV